MDYAENYERCCKEETTAFQRYFVSLLAKKAEQIGQDDHRIWSLKYIMDRYFAGAEGLRVMDCGAWDGWFLSYRTEAIARKIALDFDAHFGAEMQAKGIDLVLADMEKGHFPLAGETLDLVVMTSTLEHLSNPEQIASEIRRVLKPGGLTFITVPDITKYKFHFWDDITHKRPFTINSLRFLFETHAFETVKLCPYNHNFFVAGNLFSPGIHERLMRFRANALLYIGRKPA